jgi:hypothetical protein
MRPPKKILLVGHKIDLVSTIKFAIGVHSGFIVSEAFTQEEALQLFENNHYDLVLVIGPIENMEPMLLKMKNLAAYIPMMVSWYFNRKIEPSISVADAVLLNPPMSELFERLRIMCQRKRGPRKIPLRQIGQAMMA